VPKTRPTDADRIGSLAIAAITTTIVASTMSETMSGDPLRRSMAPEWTAVLTPYA
jgi:hypothetical protein